MMKWEARMIGGIEKKILWWAVGASALLGVFIRYSFLPLVVADMEFMVGNWYNIAGSSGLAAVARESTYSPLYLYVLTWVAKSGLSNVMGIKLITLVCECLLFLAASLTVYLVAPSAKKKLYTAITFMLLCFHPLLILNGAGWGQSDICFVAFSILAVWLLLQNKSIWAMVSLGVALAIKLQAVFILPAFIIYYFCEKKFSIWQFFIIPAIWILSGVPMAFVGESPLYAVTAYLNQTEEYIKPTFNYPNLYALLGDALGNKQMIHGMFSRYGMVLAIGSMGGMLAWLLAKKARIGNRAMLLLCSWCVLCAVFFMPRMHERYGIVGEVLLLCWAVSKGRPRGFAYLLLGLLPIASAYAEYMFRYPFFPLQIGGFLNLILMGVLTWELLRETGTLSGRAQCALPLMEDIAKAGGSAK